MKPTNKKYIYDLYNAGKTVVGTIHACKFGSTSPIDKLPIRTILFSHPFIATGSHSPPLWCHRLNPFISANIRILRISTIKYLVPHKSVTQTYLKQLNIYTSFYFVFNTETPFCGFHLNSYYLVEPMAKILTF